MLVLSRHRSEKITIGENAEIEIMVCEIRGDKVRLGITAPQGIPVHRREVFEAIKREQLTEEEWREWYDKNKGGDDLPPPSGEGGSESDPGPTSPS